MYIAAELAEYIGNLTFTQLPKDVVQAAKERVLDYLGVSFLGYRLGRYRPFLKAFGPNVDGFATVIGEGIKVAPAIAACLNGIMSHSTTYEDGSRFAALHPASVVIPAALAVTESEKTSGQALLTAVVAGYEVMVRIGTALNPSAVHRGFHPTGIVGPLGAAAAVAKTLNLNPKQIAAAIAIAASQGSGLMEAFSDLGSQPLHVGRAAASGVIAGALAREGVTGVEAILEKAYLKAYGNTFDEAAVLAGLGERFKIKETYLKLHGGCRHVHAPIDAVKEIVNRNQLAPEEIERIEIETYSLAVTLDKHDPRDVSEATFSIPFAVAVQVLTGDAYIDKFCEAVLRRPDVKEFMTRVKVRIDSEWDRVYPEIRGCRCYINTKSGKTYECRLDFAKGEPESPFSFAEIQEKFLRLASPVVGAEKSNQISKRVDELDLMEDVTALTALLQANE